MTQVQCRYSLVNQATRLIVLSNNEDKLAVSCSLELLPLPNLTCSDLRRNANRSPKANDRKSEIFYHSADCSLGYLPILGHLMNGQKLIS
jgi:hypothetical protein